ncbi:histidine phosphatase family protein [Streptomyces sp. SID13031]|uniref:histidine phosphatase family protein n=1 Tax=Streptomyces sp. SID13031 TaxID=2706046 RepID=UPI0013C99196|nr:histidine phosphatase family protein [Streptomyces sp. SID13031]NEA32050.1 histidine phosphatase family protein [Streptomyces sp. SID13031]
MSGTATRYLYLARHGQALPDQSGLSANGRRQAELLGRRLRDVPLSAFHHSPLPRAVQTAQVIGEQLQAAVALEVSEAAGDYLPAAPKQGEVPAEYADFVLNVLAQFTPDELDEGPVLALKALELFTGPVDGADDRHELLVTHNFLAGYLVCQAVGAAGWRWLTLNHCNAALTVLRYAPGRPASILVYNDMRHLPKDLRWTGFPPELQV